LARRFRPQQLRRMENWMAGTIHGDAESVAGALADLVDRTGADEIMASTSTYDRDALARSDAALAGLTAGARSSPPAGNQLKERATASPVGPAPASMRPRRPPHLWRTLRSRGPSGRLRAYRRSLVRRPRWGPRGNVGRPPVRCCPPPPGTS